jgi:hypothetical protein
MLRLKRLPLLFCSTGAVLLLVTPLRSASVPKGFETIFKGIEPGKKFYPSWPPLVGQTPVGIMVQAKDPSKPQALFESIESGTFRNGQYRGSFEIATNEYISPEYTAERNIEVDVAFTQLDAVAEQLSGKQPAVPLPGEATANKPAAQGGSPTPPGAGDKKPSEVTGSGTEKPQEGKKDKAAEDTKEGMVG